MRAQLFDVLPYLAAAGVMGVVVLMLNWLPFGHSAGLLVSQLTVGSAVYFLICRGFRLPVFMDVWHLFRIRVVPSRPV